MSEAETNISQFKHIATAIAFSPRLEANIAEALLLAHKFDAKVTFIHVGEQTAQKERELNQLIEKHDHKAEFHIVWCEGKPVKAILAKCEQNDVDLLIAGALEKESLVEFYVGSVARKLCRKAPCSVLLLTQPKVEGSVMDHIIVNGHQHPKTPRAIHTALYVSEHIQAKTLTIVDELDKEPTEVEVVDDATLDESVSLRQQTASKEKQRIDKIISAYPNPLNTKIIKRCIFGQQGYTIAHFAQSVNADLLIVNSPDKKLAFFDRFFTHDIEYILTEIPCNLLIVRDTEEE